MSNKATLLICACPQRRFRTSPVWLALLQTVPHYLSHLSEDGPKRRTQSCCIAFSCNVSINQSGGSQQTCTIKNHVALQGNPMAFLVEAAGGRAITHEGPVLDIVPTSIHERCPIFLGSKTDIDEIEAIFHAKA